MDIAELEKDEFPCENPLLPPKELFCELNALLN